MNPRIARLDHLQIAAPQGCEAAAREFYGDLLGLREIEKPHTLRTRGGWFECGTQQLHIGVEPDFRPAKKAHPAFVAGNLDDLRQALLAESKLRMTPLSPAPAAFLPQTPGAIASNSWKLGFQTPPDDILPPVRFRHKLIPKSRTCTLSESPKSPLTHIP